MLTRKSINNLKKIKSYEQYIEGYIAWKKAKAESQVVNLKKEN